MSEIEYSSLFGVMLISEPWASTLAETERQIRWVQDMPGSMFGHIPQETHIEKLYRLGILDDGSHW